jgi:hypothetical protein
MRISSYQLRSSVTSNEAHGHASQQSIAAQRRCQPAAVLFQIS